MIVMSKMSSPGIVRGGSRTAPGAWDMNETPSQGIPTVGTPFDVVSDSSIAPVFGSGITCALSPTWETGPGAVSGSAGVDPRMRGPTIDRSDGDGMTLQTRDRGTLTLTPCSPAARDRSVPSRSLQGMDHVGQRIFLQLRLPRPGLTARRRSRGCNHPGPRRAWPRGPAVWRLRGYSGLIDALIAKLSRDQGIQARRENVLITAGGSQAIDLLLDALVDWGDTIISEMPTWVGAVQAFRNASGPTSSRFRSMTRAST